MSDNPHDILGVQASASDAELRQAYLRLVKLTHPDRNPDDPNAEAMFRKVHDAYRALARERYPAGVDAAIDDGLGFAWRGSDHLEGDFGGPEAAFVAADDAWHEEDASLRYGLDLRATLHVDFAGAALGCVKTLKLQRGEVRVEVPAGLEDGETVRVRGRGRAGLHEGVLGDLLVTVLVEPHPTFTRLGADVFSEAEVTLRAAVAGGKLAVPTLDGEVTIVIPPWSNAGKRLRLRGLGAFDRATEARGDHVLRLLPVLPDPSSKQGEALREWARPPASKRKAKKAKA